MGKYKLFCDDCESRPAKFMCPECDKLFCDRCDDDNFGICKLCAPHTLKIKGIKMK